MRVVGQYLAKAAVYEALADSESDPVQKANYADLVAYYRSLAQERQWERAKDAMRLDPTRRGTGPNR